VLGLVAAAISAAFFAASGHWTQAGAAAVSVGVFLVWLAFYLRVAKPINQQQTAAADDPTLAVDARALQRDWDKIINTRAILQGLSVTALCVALMV
jgi:hypothetical protein